MYSYKEESLRRRYARQGCGYRAREPRKIKKKAPAKKPWMVVAIPHNGKEYCAYKSATEQQCKNWVAKELRPYYHGLYTYEIIGPQDGEQPNT